jgi:hypothetical protein
MEKEMIKYQVLRGGMASQRVESGEILYPGNDSYGCANDDTRILGLEYIAVSRLKKGIPFFTIPLMDVKVIKDENISSGR